MGHASIETTLKFYAQPTKDRLEAAANIVGEYIAITATHTED